MKNLFGCLLALALLPVAAFVIYFIFNIFLYFAGCSINGQSFGIGAFDFINRFPHHVM